MCGERGGGGLDGRYFAPPKRTSRRMLSRAIRGAGALRLGGVSASSLRVQAVRGMSGGGGDHGFGPVTDPEQEPRFLECVKQYFDTVRAAAAWEMRRGRGPKWFVGGPGRGWRGGRGGGGVCRRRAS
jgi:hypothetical protein